MSNYSQTTFFTPKDSLPPTNPAKTIFGAAYDVEFGNIATAITSKADAVSTISSITGTANQIGVVNVAGAVTLGLQQNVIIPTPASGVALTVSQVGTAIGLQINQVGAQDALLVFSNTGVRSGLEIAQGGTVSWNLYNPASSTDLRLAQTTDRVIFGAAGNVTINAPSSGIGLLLNTTDSVTAFEWATASTIVQGQTSGANSFFGTSNSSSFNLITNNQNRLGISNSGAVTIAAPTAATALAVAGAASQHVANFIANSTAGGSFGVLIEAGTNASDAALEVLNQAASTAYFQVLGNGGVVVGAPTGGNQGLGTVNATGLFVNGGQLFFGVPTSGSTTAAVTDVGKMINTGVNLAINTGIFSQGHILSVYNNSASAITINGTIATMRLAGTATTGNRTLAPRGLATLWFESGAEVIVSGPGVS